MHLVEVGNQCIVISSFARASFRGAPGGTLLRSFTLPVLSDPAHSVSELAPPEKGPAAHSKTLGA